MHAKMGISNRARTQGRSSNTVIVSTARIRHALRCQGFAVQASDLRHYQSCQSIDTGFVGVLVATDYVHFVHGYPALTCNARQQPGRIVDIGLQGPRSLRIALDAGKT